MRVASTISVNKSLQGDKLSLNNLSNSVTKGSYCFFPETKGENIHRRFLNQQSTYDPAFASMISFSKN